MKPESRFQAKCTANALSITIRIRRSLLFNWRQAISTWFCAMACASIAGAAAAAPYNPDHLETGEAVRVGEICKNVMGLSPDEPPIWGDAIIGDPHLERGASHYQGCVTVLSDSLQSLETLDLAARADADCRSKGELPNSPGLAECALQSEETTSPSTTKSAEALAVTPVAESLRSKPVGSMFFASPGETLRREKFACAALGLEPPYGAFSNCVKDLEDTFYAIDNPVN